MTNVGHFLHKTYFFIFAIFCGGRSDEPVKKCWLMSEKREINILNLNLFNEIYAYISVYF